MQCGKNLKNAYTLLTTVNSARLSYVCVCVRVWSVQVESTMRPCSASTTVFFSARKISHSWTSSLTASGTCEHSWNRLAPPPTRRRPPPPSTETRRKLRHAAVMTSLSEWVTWHRRRQRLLRRARSLRQWQWRYEQKTIAIMSTAVDRRNALRQRLVRQSLCLNTSLQHRRPLRLPLRCSYRPWYASYCGGTVPRDVSVYFRRRHRRDRAFPLDRPLEHPAAYD